MKKEKQSAQVCASDATAKDVAQVINEQSKLQESGKSQTNQRESESDKQSELTGTLVDFAQVAKDWADKFAFIKLKNLLSQSGENEKFIDIFSYAKRVSKCGLDDATIKKQLENVFQICKLEKIYSQIDESTDKASATPEELKIKVNKKVFSIAARKDSDGKFEFVEVNDTDTLLRAFKGSFAVWTQKSLEQAKIAKEKAMSNEAFKQSKRNEYNAWILSRQARGLSTDKSFADWFALNYE